MYIDTHRSMLYKETHLYTTAVINTHIKTYISVYRWHSQSCKRNCMQDHIPGLECIYVLLHTQPAHTHTCSLLWALGNYESMAPPLVLQHLRRPPLPLLPLPRPYDRQLLLLSTPWLPSDSHPLGVPRTLINPLTNWPPAP